VNLAAAPGEVLAVTGGNGAGKSILLACLAGLHQPSAGTLNVQSERNGLATAAAQLVTSGLVLGAFLLLAPRRGR